MSKNFAYVGLVMGAIFCIGGLLLVIRPSFIALPPTFNGFEGVIGGIVVIYGAFRIYRSILALRENRDSL